MLVPTRKRSDIRIEDDPILVGLPDFMRSHEGIVVLTAVRNGRGRCWRRHFVVGTCEAIPVGCHCRVIALNINALARNDVMAKLRSWKVVAEPDSCQKINNRVMT